MTIFSVFTRGTITLLIGLFVIPPTAYAADVTVAVTGAVKDSTCTVPTPALTLVNMGSSNNINELQQTGNVGAAVKFILKLENCGADAQGVAVTFRGTPDTDNNTVLALDTVPDSATGIGLQLMSSTSEPLNLGDVSTNQQLTADQGAELPFWARYIATRDKATAGRAWATATVDFTYQ